MAIIGASAFIEHGEFIVVSNDVDPIAYEVCSCPLCGEEQREETPYRSAEVAVVRCTSCRLWYLSPRPTAESMAAVYSGSEYFEGEGDGYDSYDLQAQSLRATFRAFLRVLQRRGMTGGSLLEVGCGYGFLLAEAASYFDKRVGCDFSAEAVRRVTNADEVYVGGTEAIPLEQRFDCIVATHVIEHVHAPIPFVQELASRLREGGWLVLAAPDMGSFWRKLMRHRWPSFKFPEHVVFYDRSTLPRVFQAADLQSIQAVSYPHAFPMSLVCAKLGIRGPRTFDRFSLWLPATTVAFAGQRAGDATR